MGEGRDWRAIFSQSVFGLMDNLVDVDCISTSGVRSGRTDRVFYLTLCYLRVLPHLLLKSEVGTMLCFFRLHFGSGTPIHTCRQIDDR